jgi:hypothetical protein
MLDFGRPICNSSYIQIESDNPLGDSPTSYWFRDLQGCLSSKSELVELLSYQENLSCVGASFPCVPAFPAWQGRCTVLFSSHIPVFVILCPCLPRLRSTRIVRLEPDDVACHDCLCEENQCQLPKPLLRTTQISEWPTNWTRLAQTKHRVTSYKLN